MKVFSVHGFSIKRGGVPVLQDLNFSLHQQKPLAVIGPSGSGKTTLLEAIAGRLFYTGELAFNAAPRIAYVPQQHHYRNLSHTDTFYYQQRFNSSDAADAQTVAETVPALFAAGNVAINERVKMIGSMFSLDDLKQRRLLQLSNGEHKRLQLAQALLKEPDLLLLDAPFTGLDTENRKLLEASLSALCVGGIAVMLTSASSRIPHFVQEVMALDGAGKGMMLSVPEARKKEQVTALPEPAPKLLQALLQHATGANFAYAVQMSGVHIRYSDKQVLQNISWQVARGQCWSLSGRNGAGKSTLLSLITADNPQAYSNEIYLFDKRRGSGESIWDIKRKIGFVSPELHLHFDKSATVFDTIASGFFDTIGLFRKVTDAQAATVAGWLQLLQLEPLAERMLWQQSLGTQRLVLLARAMVKAPPLLVLDEPLQGLGESQAAIIKSMIDNICSHTEQTLIFVSHYTDDLPQCITHYLRLKEGMIVQ